MWVLRVAAGLAAAALAAGAPARADVKARAADGLVIQVKVETPRTRDEAWARLLDIAAWWGSEHTYSGDGRNLSIDARAGGCWCESWSQGEVEHGRVIFVSPASVLRLEAPIGPLQAMGAQAVMTLTLSDGRRPGETALTLDFVVSGSSLSGLDQMAGVIDQVLTLEAQRFAEPG